MFVGIFDFYMLIIVFIFNYAVWKHKIIRKCSWKINLAAFLLFGLVFPLLSIDIEIAVISNEIQNIDNFTLLYTLFRFPIWWLIGILEVNYIWNQVKNRAAS